MLAKIKKNTNKQIFVIVFGCFVWLLTHPVVEMFARELPSLALMRLRNALFNSSKWSQNVESILSENPKKSAETKAESVMHYLLITLQKLH